MDGLSSFFSENSSSSVNSLWFSSVNAEDTDLSLDTLFTEDDLFEMVPFSASSSSSIKIALLATLWFDGTGFR